MKKKQYISPKSEVMNLRAMHAMMDETPLFGVASRPNQPFGGAPRKRWTDVF